MRSKQNLERELKRKKIDAVIVDLDGECMGIVHEKGKREYVMDICELLGYAFLEPYEYEYSYQKKPVGTIIIF